MSKKLLDAALVEDWQYFKQILEANDELPDINISDNNNGLTPLVLAATHKQWELVFLMITKFHNVNVNAHQTSRSNRYEQFGKTPLWFAVYKRQWFIVEALQECGAKLIYPVGLSKTWEQDGYDYRQHLRKFGSWPTEFVEGPMIDFANIDRQISLNSRRYVFLPPADKALVPSREGSEKSKDKKAEAALGRQRYEMFQVKDQLEREVSRVKELLTDYYRRKP